MDWIKLPQKAAALLWKYKYVFAIFLLGIVFLLIPTGEESKTPVVSQEEPEKQPQLQEDLALLLSKIDGAGRVELLLTCAAGEEILYQSDLDGSQSDDSFDENRKTVIITDAGRDQQAVIRQILPPVYLGAVVVCQGGDDPAVRLAVVDAVSKATGLSTDKITVLKMK